MGNQEKAEPGDTVMATSTRLFQGRVVRDSNEKKGESLLASTPVVVLSSVLGRTPTIEEYKAAVDGIDLTRFDPPTEELTATPVSIGRLSTRPPGSTSARPDPQRRKLRPLVGGA